MYMCTCIYICANNLCHNYTQLIRAMIEHGVLVKGLGPKSWKSVFWSACQRIFAQLILAFKVRTHEETRMMHTCPTVDLIYRIVVHFPAHTHYLWCFFHILGGHGVHCSRTSHKGGKVCCDRPGVDRYGQLLYCCCCCDMGCTSETLQRKYTHS